MFNRAVAHFLRPFLEQYFKDFDSSRIEVEILNGRAHLTDLNFKENCLIQHQIPFYIKRGLVNSFTLSISSEQCEIKINNLFINGSEVFNSTFIPNDFSTNSKSVIMNYIFPIIQSILNIFFDSSLDSMRKLFDNLSVKIEKVHIRFEGLMNKTQAFGVIIKSIIMNSIDHEGEKVIVKNHPPTFLKQIVFNHFGLYFDAEAVLIKKDEFEQQMLIEISSMKHDFIFDPFSFRCIFEYSTESNTVTNLNVVINKINLFLKLKQIDALKKLKNYFHIQRKFNHLDRPPKTMRSERSGSSWWYYSYKCIAFKKNKRQPLNIQRAIDVLKKRKFFFEIWKKFIANPERHKKEYNDYINTLSFNTLPLLRYYSSFVISKKIGYSTTEINESEIFRFFGEQKKIFPFKFNVLFEDELIIGIKDNSNKEITSFDIHGLTVNGEKNQDLTSVSQKVNHSINFNADSIQFNNNLNERYCKMIEFKNGIKGSVEFNHVDPTHISLNVNSFSFVFDADFLSNFLRLFNDFGTFLGIEIKEKNEDDKKALIDSHQKIKLDFVVGKSNLLIPYQEIEQDQPILQISLDSLEVHSNPSAKYDINKIDSLFDEYKISINSLQIFLNEKQISNKINLNSLIKYRILSIKDNETIKVNCEISPLNIRLTIFQAILLNELFSYISEKLIIESIKTSNFSSDFTIFVDVHPIDILLMYEEKEELLNTESFQVNLKEHTSINISNKNQNLTVLVLNNLGIECLEFFGSKVGKFLNTKKFDLNIASDKQKTNINLNIDDIDVYAKAVLLNFLIVLAEFPKDFEWMLHFKEESSISKYLYASKKKLKSKDVNVNVHLNNINLHLIEIELKKGDRGVTIDENEFLSLSTNQINVSVNQMQNKNEIKIEIDPLQVKSTQFGPIWTDIISKNENPPSSIVINLTPTSVAFEIDKFQANLSPLLLLKIIKFALIARNNYVYQHGDPITVKFLKLNIKIHKVVIRLIHDIESYNYYELNVTDFIFNTIEAPMIHQLQCNCIQIIQKIQKRKDYLIFDIKNLNFILWMKFLLRDNVNQNKAKSFNELIDEKGLENWIEITNNFIRENEDESILSNSFFYFYFLALKIEIDELLSIYSHEFARNICSVASRFFDILKKDIFYNYKNHKFQNMDNRLDISVDFKMKTGNFSIVDQSYLLLAKLTLNQINFEIDPKNWIYNAHVNQIILIGENEEEKILETGQICIETIDDDIYANLESLYLYIKLKYWPDTVYYIMNCPLFSFADEFNENVQKQTSFEMKMGLFFSLSDLKITLPIQENLVNLKTSFDVLIMPEGNFVHVHEIHMILNDKVIMKPFSIIFENNEWNLDPIFITFSVFDVHIIGSLISEINSLTMPQIYLFKKENEMKKRKFSVNLKKIDIILTQPNLPFVSLEIKPSTFKQSFSERNENEKIIEYNVELLLKHENYTNHGTDIIIDPFKISIKSSVINHKSSTKAEISPINIALSSSFLFEIFQFKNKYSLYKNSNYDLKVFQERIIYFQNDTSLPITIHLLKRNSLEKKSIQLLNNNPISLNEYDLKSKIIISYDDYKSIEFLIQDLFYPIFYDKTFVLYLNAVFGVQTIHFSSPYIVKNQLYYDLDVCIDGKSIGIIKKGKEKTIPTFLLQYLSKGISAVNNSVSKPSATINIIDHKQQIYKFFNEQNKKNFYSSVYVTTDPQRSLRIISFLPYITFENQLPIKVNVSFLSYDIDYDLKPGKKHDVSYLKDKIFKLRIKLKIEPFGESDETEITTYDKKPNPVRIPIKRDKKIKCRIAFMSIFDEKTGTYNNIIFSPCILYNETGAALSIKGSSKKFYPFINNMCFYTPKEFISPGPFKSKNIPLRLKLQDITEINSNEINCLKIKSIEKISLPFTDNKEIFFQISAIRKKSDFENTVNLVLKVHFTVFNHLNSDIYLIPSNIKLINDESFFSDNILVNMYRICCKKNDKSLIVTSNLEGKFYLSMKKYDVCKEVNFINQTTTVFRLISKIKNEPDVLIQLDLIKEKGGFCAHFSYASFPSPLVISNMIPNAIISVKQKSKSDEQNPLLVQSLSTSLFAKRQPFIEKDLIYENFVCITILQQNKQFDFTVPYSYDIPPQTIKKTNYLYEVKTTQKGDKMILIKQEEEKNDDDQINDQQNSRNLVLVETPFISLYISKIEVSFIDKLMRELCLLVVKNINLVYKKQESVTFTIESFRLNDMYADPVSPVVFCEKSPRFLSIEIKTKLPLKMHSFESIDIDISPLHFFVDIAFIGGLKSS